MPAAPARAPLAANLALALGAVLVAGLALALLEAGLRLAGLPAADPLQPSRLAYQRVALPLLEPAALADGTPVLRTRDPRLPVQWVAARKPAGALRVFGFGGSAAAGLGFSPNATPARELERLLRAALPGRPVEVVNLGIVALGARQVRQLLEDVCRVAEPDLLVVYSGNNEFLELHAERYALATGGAGFRAGEALRGTQLYRLVGRLLPRAASTPSLAELARSQQELRLTQDAIVEKIETRESDVAAAAARYAAELGAMADAAQAAGARLVLARVASNWRWRGREDLPRDWLDELVPAAQGPASRRERAELALARLEARIAAAARFERSEWRFRSALLREELGDLAGARRDYRAAMNEDRRLRRAVDELGDALERVARQRGALYVDSVSALAADAPHGILGFEHFYDYVHFTPRGAAVAGAAIFRALADAGAIAPEPGFDLAARRAQRLAALDALAQDPIAVEDWLGIGFGRAGIADRDLWKYEHLASELDRRIDADPRDALALAYRANARSFRQGQAAAARADYAAALAAGAPAAPLRANLARLALRGDW